MIHLNTKYVYIDNNELNFVVEYPQIIGEENNIFIGKINNKIREDINIFIDIENENFKLCKENQGVIIDYNVYFNKNNIGSLSIIFSEIYRYKNLINYIKTYNFDLNQEKLLNIQDLVKEIYRENGTISKILNEDVDDMQNFYIGEDSINLIYSSYEIYNTNEIIEKEIKFKDIYNYLSEYTIQRIMGE